jgi:hypothetical protein
LQAAHVFNFLRGHSYGAPIVFLIQLILSVISLFLTSVLTAMFFGWPFLILHRIVVKSIRARWPIMGDIHWAAAGSLIGLSIPYVFIVFLWFGVMTSSAPDAGQGMIVAPFLYMIGGVLGVVGWGAGMFASAFAPVPKQRD